VPTSDHDPACAFCDIVNRNDADAREIFRDDHVVAFLPTEPATLGHSLIIPRRHIADIWALDPDTAAELTRATLQLARAIRRAVRPDGLNIIQSNGSAASQTVMHLHVHIVPRWPNDAIGHIWPSETHYSETQKNHVCSLLKREYRTILAVDQPRIP
jgi:histidine triad (HIT) family protein